MKYARPIQLGVCIVIGACLWMRSPDVRAESATRAPWGEVTVTPLVISPPLEYIPLATGPAVVAAWHFPHLTSEGFEHALRAAGLSRDDEARLRAVTRSDPATGGYIATPDWAFVRSLDVTVRTKLYLELSGSPLNFQQLSAYRFFGASIDAWLGSELAPKTRALVDPLIYRVGDFLYFADLESVRGEIGNGPEIQRLIKLLLRQSTVLATLRIDDPSQLEGLVDYWGRGGRETDIRPLLESVANGAANHAIDIAYLLPELARHLLYRYPKVSLADLQQPQLANCFWTALNFFNDEPDERLLDPKFALQRLEHDYYIVQDELRLGDIVAFSDQNMNIFHVAVYIADDLVFTKNGFFSLAPWTLLPMEQLKGHFVEHATNWRVTYYRRKDIS